MKVAFECVLKNGKREVRHGDGIDYAACRSQVSKQRDVKKIGNSKVISGGATKSVEEQ